MTDTIVECKKCGRRQHLDFKYGLVNGWSKCCGETMSIVETHANIEKAVKFAIGATIKIEKVRVQT